MVPYFTDSIPFHFYRAQIGSTNGICRSVDFRTETIFTERGRVVNLKHRLVLISTVSDEQSYEVKI